jgi:hypothetical protein
VSDYRLDDRATGVRSPAEAKDSCCSLCVQTSSEAHPASCPMGNGGPFPGGKARPGRDANHSPHLVLRSRMSRSCTSPPHCRLHGGSGSFTFTFAFLVSNSTINTLFHFMRVHLSYTSLHLFCYQIMLWILTMQFVFSVYVLLILFISWVNIIKFMFQVFQSYIYRLYISTEIYIFFKLFSLRVFVMTVNKISMCWILK